MAKSDNESGTGFRPDGGPRTWVRAIRATGNRASRSPNRHHPASTTPHLRPGTPDIDAAGWEGTYNVVTVKFTNRDQAWTADGVSFRDRGNFALTGSPGPAAWNAHE